MYKVTLGFVVGWVKGITAIKKPASLVFSLTLLVNLLLF